MQWDFALSGCKTELKFERMHRSLCSVCSCSWMGLQVLLQALICLAMPLQALILLAMLLQALVLLPKLLQVWVLLPKLLHACRLLPLQALSMLQQELSSSRLCALVCRAGIAHEIDATFLSFDSYCQATMKYLVGCCISTIAKTPRQ